MGKKHQLSTQRVKEQLGCNYQVSLGSTEKLLRVVVPPLTFGYKEQTIFCFSQKEVSFRHSPQNSNFSHTDTRRSLLPPHTHLCEKLPEGKSAWPGSQVGRQGAEISSSPALSRDICHSHLGKLLSRSHTAQTAHKIHRHKNCQALKGCSAINSFVMAFRKCTLQISSPF